MINESKTTGGEAEVADPNSTANTADTTAEGGDVKVEVVQENNEQYQIPEAQPYPNDASATSSNQEQQNDAPAKPPQQAGAVPANGKRLLEKGTNVIKQNGGAPLVLCVASIFLIIASSVEQANRAQVWGAYAAFSVSYGVIAFAVSLAFLVLQRQNKLDELPRRVLTVFLFVWCGVGTGIVTFRAPFFVASNGYFTAWIMFLASYVMVKGEVVQIGDIEGKLRGFGEHCFPLTMASFIFLFASIAVCDGSNACTGISGYAVAVGVIGVVVCFVLAFANEKLGEKGRQGVAVFLALWWLAAVLVTTFSTQSNFGQVGNAYFSVWAALIIALLLLEAELDTSS